VQSGNDACVVVAEGLAGTEEAFARAMTERARELGLTNTTLPTPRAGRIRTPMSMRDLGILSRRIIRDFPNTTRIFAEPSTPGTTSPSSNRNPLLEARDRRGRAEDRPHAEAGYGLAGSARAGRAAGDLRHHRADDERERAEEAERIINWAFRQFRKRRLLRPAPWREAPVWLGEAPRCRWWRRGARGAGAGAEARRPDRGRGRLPRPARGAGDGRAADRRTGVRGAGLEPTCASRSWPRRTCRAAASGCGSRPRRGCWRAPGAVSDRVGRRRVLRAAAARGLFITFEGIDGSGKSTQARRLAEALRAAGRAVVLTREPGGSPGAEEIRRLLVEGEAGRWSAETEILLFTAARRDHVERTIRPALARGGVLCDRFADSTRVYQGAARGDLRGHGRPLHALPSGIEPDLTLVLDIDPGRRWRAGSPAAAARTGSRLGAEFQPGCARASWRWPGVPGPLRRDRSPRSEAEAVAAERARRWRRL
jgi:dTMP kinase